MKDSDGQARQTGIRQLQAVGDVLDGGAPSEIAGVWQRGIVLGQSQLARDSEQATRGFQVTVSQAHTHYLYSHVGEALGACSCKEA
jgi:hypothetical protein